MLLPHPESICTAELLLHKRHYGSVWNGILSYHLSVSSMNTVHSMCIFRMHGKPRWCRPLLPGSAKHNPTQLNTSVQNATLHSSCVLCRGYCFSDFSETWHVTVLNLDVLNKARSGLLRDDWMFLREHSLSLVFKNGWHWFSDQA